MGLHLRAVTAVVETHTSSTKTATINPATTEQVVIVVQEKRHKKCMQKVITTILLSLVLMGVSGQVALAQFERSPISIPRGPQSGLEVLGILVNITNWIFTIFLMIAVIFLILAAFRFVFSGGNPDAVSQARVSIIFIIIGITVAVLARGIPGVIANIVI